MPVEAKAYADFFLFVLSNNIFHLAGLDLGDICNRSCNLQVAINAVANEEVLNSWFKESSHPVEHQLGLSLKANLWVLDFLSTSQG